MRFLLVDDEPNNLTVLSSLLRQYGECDLVSNGKIALSTFKLSLDESNPYDLIFLDIMMPEMDGHSCLLAIRELEKAYKILPGKEVKVAMVSSLHDTKNVCEAFFHGQAVCYLPKPINLGHLDQLLKSTISNLST